MNEDIIVRVAGEEVNENNSLVTLIGRHRVGEQVTLTVVRGGSEVELLVTLEEAPASLF